MLKSGFGDFSGGPEESFQDFGLRFALGYAVYVSLVSKR